MALQNIIDKILSESRKKADQLNAEAGKAANDILEKGRIKAESEKEDMIRIARAKMDDDRRRRLALANLESRKQMLATRCNQISDVFVRVRRELQDIKGENLKKLIKGLLDGFVPVSSSEIICRKDDVDKYTFVLSSIWGAAFTRYCNMKGVDDDLGGGFILRSHRIEYDCTFKRMVQEKREILEAEVVKTLFPRDEKSSE